MWARLKEHLCITSSFHLISDEHHHATGQGSYSVVGTSPGKLLQYTNNPFHEYEDNEIGYSL